MPADSPPTQPKKSNKKLWLVAALAIGALCLASIVCVAVAALGVGKVALEKAPVQSVLDSYMQFMVEKDFESAYTLFSSRAQRQVPISKLQEMTEGNNYILFEGYESLSVQNLNISAAANTNQDAPQGTVAKVTGIISYEGGIQGGFNGTLEKEDGQWRIDGIFVTVPPNKFPQ